MKKILLVLGMIAFNANSTVVGFVDNVTGNSTDWAASVSNLGGAANTVDFNSHTLGALDNNFYSGTDGLTMSLGGSGGTVLDGFGPQQGAQQAPVSPGEGKHDASRHLHTNTGAMSLTLSFDQAVYGVGLFTSDLWSPNHNSRNIVSISAYTDVNGAGSLLGTFSNPVANFQNFNLYFMGITSSAGDIRSLVFNSAGGGNDRFGIDNIQYSTAAPAPVPAPTMLSLLGLTLISLVSIRKKKNA